MNKILLCVTDADRTGAPLYVNQLDFILRGSYNIEIITASKGSLLNGHVLGFNKTKIVSLKDFYALIKAILLLRSIKPDIVWLNSFKMASIMRIALLFYHRKPKVIYTIHGLSFGKKKSVKELLIMLVERVLSFGVDKYIFLTRFDYIKYSTSIHVENKYYIIPNTSNLNVPSIYRGGRSVKTFAMIARNDAQKDYLTLLKAWSLHVESFPDSLLLCIGRETNNSKMKTLIKNLGIINSVKLIGETKLMEKIYTNIDVLVLSTHYEGMPLVILEAMSTGLPVIASDVSGIHEFVSERYGRLFQEGNITELKNHLNYFSNLNSNSYLEMSLAAKKAYDSSYSEVKFSNTITKLLNKLK